MTNTPSNLKYTKEHEWVEERGAKVIRFGITDYAQGALGDIVYVQLPKVGDLIEAGKVCGEVESTKSVSEIFAPVSGKVIGVNSMLDNAPETINSDPYGSGWIAEVNITSSGELLSSTDYQAHTA
ncbi:MAG: glycine cleavage system protein GcvH [Actinobacteria bacterium]|nr:glycine cleavage system protein GcvH [Actinomycetota bacterium]